MAAIVWPRAVEPDAVPAFVPTFALTFVAAFVAEALAEAGRPARACCAAARCDTADAVHAAGAVRCHSVLSAAGKPGPQPYSPVAVRCHTPLASVNTPVAAPSWKPADSLGPAVSAGAKLAMAHCLPFAVPRCKVPGRIPPTAAAGT